MGKRHGYGTDSIRKIAEKYDGNAEFKREASRFMTRIVLIFAAAQGKSLPFNGLNGTKNRLSGINEEII